MKKVHVCWTKTHLCYDQLYFCSGSGIHEAGCAKIGQLVLANTLSLILALTAFTLQYSTVQYTTVQYSSLSRSGMDKSTVFVKG